MKKITYLFLSAMLMMFFACTQEDVQVGQPDDELSKAGKHTGPVFKVYPTGVDDTENLVQAFASAKASGPGAVVQLLEGQYTIGMIEVREFDGTFRGAGKGKTIISNLPDLPCNEYWAIDNCPFLMQFVGGNVSVSELTFHINDGIPCADSELSPWHDYFGDVMVTVLVMADYTQTYTPSNRFIKAIVNNVEFITGDIEGGYNPFGLSSNTNMTIYAGNPYMTGTGTEPLSNGDFTITGCTFDHTNIGPDFAGLGENASVKIENNEMNGTVYGLCMYCNLGSKFIVRNNTFIDGLLFDLWIDDNDYGYYPNEVLRRRTEWDISGNKFFSSPATISIFLSDWRRTHFPDEDFPQLFDIKSNTFNTQEGGTAIMGLNSIDAKIWNNTFKGTGAVGVYLEGDAGTETYAQYNKILNNNFSQSNYTGSNVYLGEFTANNMVIGVAKDKVTDLGDNNIVVGTKANKQGPHFMPVSKGPHENIHARRLGH